MPIPLAQVTVAEIAFKGLIAANGSGAVNTNFLFHYRRLATAVDPAKAALANAFIAGPVVAIAAALNARWSGTIYDIRWVNDAEDAALSVASTAVGAIAGDSLSTDQAVFQLFRTGLRGRRFKGGKHFAPISESDVGDDTIQAATLTRFNAIGTALALTLTDSTGNQWKLTLLSRKNSQLKTNPTTVSTNDVTQILVNQRIGSMLRRKVKSVY